MVFLESLCALMHGMHMWRVFFSESGRELVGVSAVS